MQLNQQHTGRDSAAKDFDDFMAKAGYSLELWVAVNAHFTFGVASLCIAVAMRCWVAFAADGAFAAFGRIATLIVCSGLSLAVSLGMPHGSRDVLVSLPLRYFKMLMARALDVRHPAPGLVASVLMFGLATALSVREFGSFLANAAAAESA